MKNKRILTITLLILSALFIADILYITSFKLNAFNQDFYSKEFHKYNIYQEFPDADSITSDVLEYLKSNSDNLDAKLFNEEEVSHFRDVKLLIQKIDIYYYSALILSVIMIVGMFFIDKKGFRINLAKLLLSSGILALSFGILVLLLAVLDFGNLFNIFHSVAFPQGGWLFSASDNIIKLYPSGFFYDMAKRIFLDSILYANILILVAVLLFLKND